MAVDTVPARWPSNLKYLRKPEISKAIDVTTKGLLSPKGVCSRTAVSATRIRLINDRTHPAHGQNGLFASHGLSPGALIVDYMGFYHLPSDADETSDYDLALRHGPLYLGIDAAKMGNEARMINDYRGVAESANAYFDSYINATGEIRMGVFVSKTGKNGIKGIRKGEEILLSYGKAFWASRQS